MTELPSEILYEVDDRVAWLTINRPESRNALNKAARDGFRLAFERFNADDSASVLVITGAGDKAFCAGADIKEMADTSLKIPPKDFMVYLNRTIDVKKPVIAAVNGFAYAGGFLLAQQVDLCIASEHAMFGITEAKIGRGAPWAAPLPWIIGPRLTMEILLTADPFDAQRAYEIGFVNKVVPAEKLHEEAAAMARKIAENAPLSVQAAKEMVFASADHGWEEGLDVADEIYEKVYLSEDGQEGPRAFSEKRKPVWEGR